MKLFEEKLTQPFKAAIATLLICCTQPSIVFPNQSNSPEYNFAIIDQSLKKFFANLSQITNSRFDISSGIIARANNIQLSGSTEEILNQLSKKYDLDWFRYNEIYYVSKKEEAETRIITLGNLDYEGTLENINLSGFSTQKYPITPAAEKTAAVLFGPPKYLAIFETLIETLPEKKLPLIISKKSKKIIVRRALEKEIVNINNTEIKNN